MERLRMSELKSCPFCGGEARVVKDGRWTDQSVIYAVVCGECHAMSRWCESEEEAIEAWNTRAERTCENQYDNPSLFRCSECDDVREVWEPNFCPNCGVKVMSE